MQKITAKQIAINASEKNFYFQKNLILEEDIKKLTEKIKFLENELLVVKIPPLDVSLAREWTIDNLTSAKIQYIYSIYKKFPKPVRYLNSLIFTHILKK